jgi:hypothetical protein
MAKQKVILPKGNPVGEKMKPLPMKKKKKKKKK